MKDTVMLNIVSGCWTRCFKAYQDVVLFEVAEIVTNLSTFKMAARDDVNAAALYKYKSYTFSH